MLSAGAGADHGGESLDQAHRAHAGAALGADDQMVVHRHLHVPPGLNQVSRQANVLAGRRRIAARVVVDDDDSELDLWNRNRQKNLAVATCASGSRKRPFCCPKGIGTALILRIARPVHFGKLPIGTVVPMTKSPRFPATFLLENAPGILLLGASSSDGQ
jgi:hypothetical protein